MIDDVVNGHGSGIKCRNRRHDDRSHFRHLRHGPQVAQVIRRLSDRQNKPAAFLQHDVGSPCEQAGGNPARNPGQRPDRAWSDKHSHCLKRSARYRRSDIVGPIDDVRQRRQAIRVVLGPQDDYFTATAIKDFLQGSYGITPASDRKGFRLAGPLLEHKGDYNIVSDGTVAGSIQVPGSKLPIVLMADAQTTGGYPKIATVISADLPVLWRSRRRPHRPISVRVARRCREDSSCRAPTTSEGYFGYTSCKRISTHWCRSLVQSKPDRRRHRRERVTLSPPVPGHALPNTPPCGLWIRRDF
jgi:hypothetical protein